MAKTRRPPQRRKTTDRTPSSRPGRKQAQTTEASPRSSGSPRQRSEAVKPTGDQQRSQPSRTSRQRPETAKATGEQQRSRGPRTTREPASGSEQVGDHDWAYGLHTLEEMLGSQAQAIEEIVVMEGARGRLARLAQQAQEQGHLVKFRPRAYLQRLLGDVNFQGVGIRVRDFPYTELDDLLIDPGQRALLFAVSVQDPGNLGALLRSARAFGVSGVILSQREGCGVTATVRKVSAGAASSMPIARVRNLTQAMRQMKEAGWWLVGLAGEGTTEIDQFDLALPVIFLLGAEGKGLPPSVQKQCDVLLRIPMVPDWDSLNVAASGAIALYEWHRQARSR